MTSIWVLFWLQFAGILHFVIFAIREMCAALNVPFFTVWDVEARAAAIELLNGSKVVEGQEQA